MLLGRMPCMPVKAAAAGGNLTPSPALPLLLLQLFKERLGLIIEGEDEMACMVEGCNFLLNAGEGQRCQGGRATVAGQGRQKR